MAMDLNVYKIRLVFESPVALPFRRARLGYLGIPKHIPAATLRGSVIAALYRERMIDEKRMRNEAMYPSIITSPAYPVINGLESKPAHPFIFQCKKCEAEGRQQGSAFKIDSAERLMSSDLVNFEPPCGHRALKQLHPTPIVFYNGRIVEAGVSGFRYISLNMSRRRAAGVKGVLYSYEALDESHEFWATLASPDELGLDKLLLLMGRGISRGMGRVRVSNSERVDVSKEAEKLSNTGDGQVLFTAISPLLGSDPSSPEWTTYPKVIELQDLAKAVGVDAVGELRVDEAYGRTFTFDAGWDMMRSQLRPRFEAKNPGTVVKASLKNVYGDVGETLAALRYVGTKMLHDGSTPITGVNMLEKVEV